MLRKKRITKAQDERRRELLDAARELFVEKGYEETSVSDIVGRVDVAQGTFYLYFRSKQEILIAILRELLEHLAAIMRHIADDEELPAVDKLRTMWSEVIARMADQSKLVQAFYLRVNVPLHAEILKDLDSLILPVLSKVIRQGVADGVFWVTHVEAAASFVLTLGYRLFEHVAQERLAMAGPEAVKGTTSRPDGQSVLSQALWEFILGGLGAGSSTEGKR